MVKMPEHDLDVVTTLCDEFKMSRHIHIYIADDEVEKCWVMEPLSGIVDHLTQQMQAKSTPDLHISIYHHFDFLNIILKFWFFSLPFTYLFYQQNGH